MEENTRNAPHNNGKGISLGLVDPETLFREGISRIISELGGFTFAFSLSNAEDAIECLAQSAPAMLITEIALPGRSGLDLLLELRRRKLSSSRIMVLSRVDTEAVVRQALASGAISYVLKSDSCEDFRRAVESTLKGESYTTQSLASALESPRSLSVSIERLVSDPLAALSPREREIFFLLAGGDHNTAIAKKLFISPRTVETHRSRVVKKLGLSSNAELIRFAIRHGLSVVA